MELLASFVDLFMHLDKHLSMIIQQFGVLTYVILFLVIFCETGLVVTPILPGDSLLFVVGAFAARGDFDPVTVYVLLCIAAVAGNMTNYHIGRFVGPKVFDKNVRFLKKEYLERTHAFYEKHGGKTIVIARFLPIIRTFAPFVAGIGRMDYRRFVLYNFAGCMAWITSFVLGGYLFGNISVVKQNLTLVIFAIIIISLVPSVVEILRQRRAASK
ncbi:MAG TPA: DedA family protein [Dissulfurispiraceae bacterium]|nr:DedA family protein [Dissulfurispiraceae bacterium]